MRVHVSTPVYVCVSERAYMRVYGCVRVVCVCVHGVCVLLLLLLCVCVYVCERWLAHTCYHLRQKVEP